MANDLLYGLLPSHLLLGLIALLMLLEVLRASERWARVAVIAVMVAALVALAHQAGAGYGAPIVPGEIEIDALSLFGKAVLLACGLGLAVGFPGAGGYRFWLLAACSILGGLVILDSAGFASLFMGVELLSLPAFALVVHGRGGGVASEGAFKYLVLSSVASALMLLGISLAYGATGSLAIATWAPLLAQGGAHARAAGVLVLGGLFLKAAVFPFHGWAPDAYASARMPVTALLATVVKAAVVLALVRIVAAQPLDPTSAAIVTALALASIFFGNLAALGQRRFKRLLAYSSVAHAGYMIFALLDTTGQRTGDLLWYTAFYALATLLACAAYELLCPGDDDDLAALDGKFAQRPFAALLLGFAMLSLAGLPPFPGFFAKVFVFRSVVASGQLAPAVAAFAGSFLGLTYYLGIVLRLFRTHVQRRPA
jgi:NADH-quinone oxidoreductase subunit N